MSPLILKETSSGYSSYGIGDEMLKNRKVFCIGEINADSVSSAIMQLLYLEDEDPDAPVTIYINSCGGEVGSGLALYDVMNTISCPVHTVCLGTAASMGAVIFTAGKERKMLPHSRIIIHDPLTSGISGSALAVQIATEELMKTREIIAEILSEHTKQSYEDILDKTKQDTAFSAEEAIQFGLADAVIKKFR